MDSFKLFQDNKLAREAAMKDEKQEEFFHTSTYGAAQNSGRIGTAGNGETFSTRQAADQDRKQVGKYRDSQMISEISRQQALARGAARPAGELGELHDQTGAKVNVGNRQDMFGRQAGQGPVRGGFGRTSGQPAGSAAAGASVYGRALGREMPTGTAAAQAVHGPAGEAGGAPRRAGIRQSAADGGVRGYGRSLGSGGFGGGSAPGGPGGARTGGPSFRPNFRPGGK